MDGADISQNLDMEVIRSIKSYQYPDPLRSVCQLIFAVTALIACYAVFLAGVSHHQYAVLLGAPLASGLTIRVFILQHDCGHGSLFRQGWLNDWAGRLCSLLTLTPYDHWKKHHAIHHGSWNNMDTRGLLSNIYSDCLSVSEYLAMSRVQRIFYRISKSPIITIFLMPPVIFFLVYRIAFDTPLVWVRERVGLYTTNLFIALLYGSLIYKFGFATVSIVLIAVVYPASVAGVWLFLVQHKFEGVRWTRGGEWHAFDASLTGCSYLRLPSLLMWFSGDIGLHHVHHAAPGIPNYRLAECHRLHHQLHGVRVLSLWEGVREAFKNELWDEERGIMVPLRSVMDH